MCFSRNVLVYIYIQVKTRVLTDTYMTIYIQSSVRSEMSHGVSVVTHTHTDYTLQAAKERVVCGNVNSYR